ncbi:MAG: RdgB/HAM1 family non-canonical purine NTP pyrophosphatase [Rubricoccaceae bacterium]
MPLPRTLVLATRNPGKVAELEARLASLGGPLTLVSAGALPDAPDVDEDAPTLEGNAEKKARALAAHTGLPALADDTGLEVDALGGAPGVRSARFAGPGADDAANRAQLLALLGDRADRAARFRTVLAYAEPPAAHGPESRAAESRVHFFEGVCTGRIGTAERGAGGFGYDALFVPDEGDGRTFAEMSTAEKNRLSHRGRALEAFAAFLAAPAAAPDAP